MYGDTTVCRPGPATLRADLARRCDLGHLGHLTS